MKSLKEPTISPLGGDKNKDDDDESIEMVDNSKNNKKVKCYFFSPKKAIFSMYKTFYTSPKTLFTY